MEEVGHILLNFGVILGAGAEIAMLLVFVTLGINLPFGALWQYLLGGLLVMAVFIFVARGVEGAEIAVSLVALAVICTLLLQATTAGYIARRLGLIEEPQPEAPG